MPARNPEKRVSVLTPTRRPVHYDTQFQTPARSTHLKQDIFRKSPYQRNLATMTSHRKKKVTRKETRKREREERRREQSSEEGQGPPQRRRAPPAQESTSVTSRSTHGRMPDNSTRHQPGNQQSVPEGTTVTPEAASTQGTKRPLPQPVEASVVGGQPVASPQRQSGCLIHISTPSPVKGDPSQLRTTLDPNLANKQQRAAAMGESQQKRQEKKKAPLQEDNIYHFLRKSRDKPKGSDRTCKEILNHANRNFRTATKSAPSSTRQTKAEALSSSSDAPATNTTDLPTALSKFDFASAPVLLSHNHRRYLLEDVMYATVGTELVILVSPTLPTFNFWGSRLANYYRTRHPMPILRLYFNRQHHQFFSVPIVVLATPARDNLVNGFKTQKDIGNMVARKGGDGGGCIYFCFKGSNERLQLLYRDILPLSKGMSVQVWGTAFDPL